MTQSAPPGPRVDAVAALSDSWFGTGLSPEAVARLAALATFREIAAGEDVLHEGEITETFGIVLAGRIALRMLVPERGNVTILTVEAGDVLGWSALVPPHRATATAIAVEPAAILSFDAEALRERLRVDHALAASLYPRVLQAASRRLNATRLQLLDLFGRDLPREPIPW